MPHATELIEHNMTVTVSDEGAAVRVAEMFARFMVAVSAEPDATVNTSVQRYDVECSHDGDEHEAQL